MAATLRRSRCRTSLTRRVFTGLEEISSPAQLRSILLKAQTGRPTMPAARYDTPPLSDEPLFVHVMVELSQRQCFPRLQKH